MVLAIKMVLIGKDQVGPIATGASNRGFFLGRDSEGNRYPQEVQARECCAIFRIRHQGQLPMGAPLSPAS